MKFTIKIEFDKNWTKINFFQITLIEMEQNEFLLQKSDSFDLHQIEFLFIGSWLNRQFTEIVSRCCTNLISCRFDCIFCFFYHSYYMIWCVYNTLFWTYMSFNNAPWTLFLNLLENCFKKLLTVKVYHLWLQLS